MLLVAQASAREPHGMVCLSSVGRLDMKHLRVKHLRVRLQTHGLSP